MKSRRSNNTKLPSLIVLVSILCIEACANGESAQSVAGKKYAKFGPRYNTQREQRGIPIIPKDWIFDANRGAWMDKILTADGITRDGFRVKPYAYKTKARHIQKSLVVENEELVKEIDVYCSGNSFKSEDPDAAHSKQLWPETLDITYVYSATKDQVGTWECFHADGKGTISLDEAKKLLKSWGLNYP